MALTSEPNKYLESLCTISRVWLLDSFAQSPSEAMPLDLLLEGPKALLAGRQLVALWEEGVWNSLCLYTGTL